MTSHALGLDFGTGSCRALIVDVRDGAELALGVADYAHGVDGVVTDPADRELARQVPADWRAASLAAIRTALAGAAEQGVAASSIVGIGVDATASTPLALAADLTPLADDPRFAHVPEALAWLWKDHTAQREAEAITAALRAHAPLALERCGGSYSAEWFWSKALAAARRAPELIASCAGFVELCDHVPAWLCGVRHPRGLVRSLGAAGHKAAYVAELGGLPSRAVLAALAREHAPAAVDAFVGLRADEDAVFAAVDRRAGGLSAAIARATGLVPDTAVAVGGIDAHLGAVGAGVREGDLVKVLGTSACDLAIVRGARAPSAAGLSGVVPDSIVPGAFGVEAGQAAFGDAFAWAARLGGAKSHADFEAEALRTAPGSSGLLALEWLNGNRCVLADPGLCGAILGLDLHTRPSEIWRAMVEAACFGARVIVERAIANGVPVARVIVCGGIARKSGFVVQTLADVLGREVVVAESSETSALGAAIAGAVAAGRHPDVPAAQAAMCRPPRRTHVPQPRAAATLDRLYGLYRKLHDAFGGVRTEALGSVMKDLRAIRAGCELGEKRTHAV
ncbi:MAG: ribulokinase [Planctomycetes bacterium]|nr:ribulokinase [Planctomycetota bacterium]